MQLDRPLPGDLGRKQELNIGIRGWAVRGQHFTRESCCSWTSPRLGYGNTQLGNVVGILVYWCRLSPVINELESYCSTSCTHCPASAASGISVGGLRVRGSESQFTDVVESPPCVKTSPRLMFLWGESGGVQCD